MAAEFRVNNASILNTLLRGLTLGPDRISTLIILDRSRLRISLVLAPNELAEVDVPGVLLNGGVPVESERLFSAQVFTSWVFVAMEEGGGNWNTAIVLNPTANADFVMIPAAAGVPPVINLQTELRDVHEFDVLFDTEFQLERPAFAISPHDFLNILFAFTFLFTFSTEEPQEVIRITLRADQQVIRFQVGNFTIPFNTAEGVLLLPDAFPAPHQAGWLATFPFFYLFHVVRMGLGYVLEGDHIMIRGTYIRYSVLDDQNRWQGTVRFLV